MTMPSQNASRRNDGGGGDRPRPLAVSQQMDDDPFGRDKNPKRRKTEPDESLSNLENLKNRICARFGVAVGEDASATLCIMW